MKTQTYHVPVTFCAWNAIDSQCFDEAVEAESYEAAEEKVRASYVAADRERCLPILVGSFSPKPTPACVLEVLNSFPRRKRRGKSRGQMPNTPAGAEQ